MPQQDSVFILGRHLAGMAKPQAFQQQEHLALMLQMLMVAVAILLIKYKLHKPHIPLVSPPKTLHQQVEMALLTSPLQTKPAHGKQVQTAIG